MMMIWWMIWYMFFNGDMVNDMAIPYRTHCLRKEGEVQLYWPTSGEGSLSLGMEKWFKPLWIFYSVMGGPSWTRWYSMFVLEGGGHVWRATDE